MILAVDVQYTENRARVAGIVFEHWQDQSAQGTYVSSIERVADYEPGKFFKRELPCILKLIAENVLEPDIIIIDGYVYLDGYSKPGLGKHLHDALDGNVIVVGVAKKPYKDIDPQYEVLRGESKKPLFVTAVGLELGQAKEYVRQMHGKNRLPTLIKQVDQICRGFQAG